MAEQETLEQLSTTGWWTILKGLPFEGGPSSTKWVYLAMNLTIAGITVAITTALCIVYIHSGDHHVDGGLLAALVSVVGIVSGCAVNALNHRRTINAQLESGQQPIAIADTPMSEHQPDAPPATP